MSYCSGVSRRRHSSSVWVTVNCLLSICVNLHWILRQHRVSAPPCVRSTGLLKYCEIGPVQYTLKESLQGRKRHAIHPARRRGRCHLRVHRDGPTGLCAVGRAVLQRQGDRFKTAELNWVGRVDSLINMVFEWKTSPVKTFADAQKIQSTLSGTGAGSTVSIYPTVMNNVFGTKFKLIMGYRGSNDAMLAVERGEVEGH